MGFENWMNTANYTHKKWSLWNTFYYVNYLPYSIIGRAMITLSYRKYIYYSILNKLAKTRSTIPSVGDFSPQTWSIPNTPAHSVRGYSNRHSNKSLSTLLGDSTSVNTTQNKSKDGLEKKSNLRTMVINCQSLKGKVGQLAAATDYIKPGVILGIESWLDNSINTSTIFPTIIWCIEKIEI